MTTVPDTVQERFPLPPGARGAPPDSGQPVSPQEILGMLRRRTVMIVLLFVLFSTLFGGLFAAWWVYFPGYRAESLVECVSNIPQTELTGEAEQLRLQREEHERFVRTQALRLKSPSILGEALKLTRVRETDWYKNVEPGRHLLALEEELLAAPVLNTNYLRVAMETRRPDDAPVIVNAVVEQWLGIVRRETAYQFADQPIKDAEQELQALESQISSVRTQIRQLASKLPPGAAHDPARSLAAQQVAQYGTQVAEYQAQLAQLDQYRQIYRDPNAPVTAEDRAIVEQDPRVAQLAQALFLLEQQLVQDQRTYGPQHRVRKQSEALIESARKDLEALRTQKLNERRRDLAEAMETAYANTQHSLLQAQENLARSEALLEDQDQDLLQYEQLNHDLERYLEEAKLLQEHLSSLKRVVRQERAVNISVAQQAIEPLERSSPSRLLVPAGALLALVLALGFGLLRELMDTSVRTPQDVTRFLQAVLLGIIPDTDDEEVRIDRVETAVWDAPRSMIAEAFRRTRTNLQFSSPVERQRSLLITSPRPEDGKTTVAANLAIALAQAGRRVLLVDANLRRPALHGVFAEVGERGLTHILVGEASAEQCIRRSALTNLDLLGAGRVPPNPVELLGSPQFRSFLAEVIGRYDQVIFDSAPVLLASDALVLSSMVDGAILVVRAKVNSKGAAARAHNLLQEVGGRLFGVVLNAAQVSRGGYFREQLRSYYDYQMDAEPEPTKPTLPPAGR